MRDLAVNDILKSADNEHLYRVLWISDDRKATYLFDMNTLEMPILTYYTELQNKINDAEFEVQDKDPYLSIICEEYLSDKDRKFRDERWNIICDIVIDEPCILNKHSRGKIVTETADRTGKTMYVIHRYLKAYWKYGKNKNAFLPNYQNCGGGGRERGANVHKRGRPRTNTVQAQA